MSTNKYSKESIAHFLTHLSVFNLSPLDKIIIYAGDQDKNFEAMIKKYVYDKYYNKFIGLDYEQLLKEYEGELERLRDLR